MAQELPVKSCHVFCRAAVFTYTNVQVVRRSSKEDMDIKGSTATSPILLNKSMVLAKSWLGLLGLARRCSSYVIEATESGFR